MTFLAQDPNRTQVTVRMDYDPQGIVESTGDNVWFMSRRVDGDLECFKEFIEQRGVETGAWRGDIDEGDTQSGVAG